MHPETTKPIKQKLLWVLGVIVAVVAIAIGKFVGGLAGREASQALMARPASTPSVEEILIYMRDEVRKTVPQNLENAILIDARASGNTFTYVYRFHNGISIVNGGTTIQHLRQVVCGGRLGNLVRRGAVIEYEYWGFTPGNRPHARIPIDHCP